MSNSCAKFFSRDDEIYVSSYFAFLGWIVVILALQELHIKHFGHNTYWKYRIDIIYIYKISKILGSVRSYFTHYFNCNCCYSTQEKHNPIKLLKLFLVPFMVLGPSPSFSFFLTKEKKTNNMEVRAIFFQISRVH